MAPEYHSVYIPPQHKESFESFVASLKGATLGRSSESKRDISLLPIEYRDRTIMELAEVVRPQLPPSAKLYDLANQDRSRVASRLGTIKDYPEWYEFLVSTFDRKQRKFINQSLGRASLTLTRHNQQGIVEEAQSFDWSQGELAPGIGPAIKIFLQELFPRIG